MAGFKRGGFGSRYTCPACGKPVQQGQPRKRLGPFTAHPECRVECAICEKEIEPHQVGQYNTISVYLSKPVHASCKYQPRGI